MAKLKIQKFLCDEMCKELGHWLRIAGHDTFVVEKPLKDDLILQQAIEENRLLLTRDHYFKQLDPEEKSICFLFSDDLDACADQLREIGVDWLYAPFSRCLRCNFPFRILSSSDPLLQTIPKGISTGWQCPKCKQLFWRGSHTEHMMSRLKTWQKEPILMIGLGGDLMIGRLVNEQLHKVPPSYIWGNLLGILKETDVNLVNLETTLTKSNNIIPKVFNFKADPESVAVLKEGNIHAVNLANNHILDFSEEGLVETLKTLDHAHVLHTGAGKNLKLAQAPCIIEKNGIKIGILGCTDNEPSWAATQFQAGVNFLEVGDLVSLKETIVSLKKTIDLLILSIHWGPNMRRRPPKDFQRFAHQLIDLGVDILHGHSAHVFQGVEIYKNKLILYDTGDFVDDYAIDPILRNDRSFLFIVKTGKTNLISLRMIPTLISQFQVNMSDEKDHLEEMLTLCNELNTYPEKENHELVLFFN